MTHPPVEGWPCFFRLLKNRLRITEHCSHVSSEKTISLSSLDNTSWIITFNISVSDPNKLNDFLRALLEIKIDRSDDGSDFDNGCTFKMLLIEEFLDKFPLLLGKMQKLCNFGPKPPCAVPHTSQFIQNYESSQNTNIRTPS